MLGKWIEVVFSYWRISKFIYARQILSDEGLPELDVTWRDGLNLISVITASNNCFIIPKKQKYDICETSHLYLFVEQLCFCLHSTDSFFVNSNVMVSKGRIMGLDYENNPTPYFHPTLQSLAYDATNIGVYQIRDRDDNV